MFVVPLVVIAACGVALLLKAGGTELRKRLGQILGVALAVYLFLSLYRVVLGVEDPGRRNALGFLLLVVAGAGLLLALLGRGTRESSLGGSSPMGSALRQLSTGRRDASGPYRRPSRSRRRPCRP